MLSGSRHTVRYFDYEEGVSFSLIEQVMVPKLCSQPLLGFFSFSDFLNLSPDAGTNAGVHRREG